MFIWKVYKFLKFCLSFSCSAQLSSVAQSCPTLCDPMNRNTPGLPVHHQLPEFTETHVHRVSDAIQPSHPLSSPSSPVNLSFIIGELVVVRGVFTKNLEGNVNKEQRGITHHSSKVKSYPSSVAHQQCNLRGILDEKQDEVLSALDT